MNPTDATTLTIQLSTAVSIMIWAGGGLTAVILLLLRLYLGAKMAEIAELKKSDAAKDARISALEHAAALAAKDREHGQKDFDSLVDDVAGMSSKIDALTAQVGNLAGQVAGLTAALSKNARVST